MVVIKHEGSSTFELNWSNIYYLHAKGRYCPILDITMTTYSSFKPDHWMWLNVKLLISYSQAFLERQRPEICQLQTIVNNFGVNLCEIYIQSILSWLVYSHMPYYNIYYMTVVLQTVDYVNYWISIIDNI